MNPREPSTSIQSCTQPEPSRCEACGAGFECGAKLAGCWCAEVNLSEATRDELRARYQRCLCRACLERFAEPVGEDKGIDTRTTEQEQSARP
ncbi:MAG TPA: cysteine-rich CWC family protein [Pyrinomonadaceae bacterium]|nr:cysteine-rich CWC family protein [Pyrinomonadaceae bacterium]